jgi:hypothetical protein
LSLLECSVDPATGQLIEYAAPAPQKVEAPAAHGVAAPAKRKRQRPSRARMQADCPECTCGRRAAADEVRKQNQVLKREDRKRTDGHAYRCRPQCPVRVWLDTSVVAK